MNRFFAVISFSLLSLSLVAGSKAQAQSQTYQSANRALRNVLKITSAKVVFSGVDPEKNTPCDILIEDKLYSDGNAGSVRADDILIVGQFQDGEGYQHIGFETGPQTPALQLASGAMNFSITYETNSWSGRGYARLILRNITIHAWPQVIIQYFSGEFQPQGNQVVCDQLKRVSG